MVSEAIMKISGLENTFWRTESDKSIHNLSGLSYRVRLTTSGSATPQPQPHFHHCQEHLHVYSSTNSSRQKVSSGEVQYAAPFHKDKGLFLLVTPFTASPLEVRDRRGGRVGTEEVRQQDSLLLLLGSGLPAWLLEGTEAAGLLHAPSHAVSSLPASLSHRTTLARMKVRGQDTGQGRTRLVLIC